MKCFGSFFFFFFRKLIKINPSFLTTMEKLIEIVEAIKTQTQSKVFSQNSE
jgi:hypothetical protein